jgi:predicted GIY-YIG superfamily endonuclease
MQASKGLASQKEELIKSLPKMWKTPLLYN